LQVTKDGCPIIFHDNFIFTQEDVSSYVVLHNVFTHGTLFYTGANIEAKSLHLHLFQGKISQKRVTDIILEDFLQYGPQNEQGKVRRVTIVLMRLRITINQPVPSDDVIFLAPE